jgi:hypothetical protein
VHPNELRAWIHEIMGEGDALCSATMTPLLGAKDWHGYTVHEQRALAGNGVLYLAGYLNDHP